LTRSLDAVQTKAFIADEVNLWRSTAEDVGIEIR
jgi:hypothetical protein